MPTIQSNRISVVLSDADIADIRAAFGTIFTKLPFLIGLTTDERVALPKMNSSNKVFSGDAITATNTNANMLPAYFSGAEMGKDFTLYNVLDEFVLQSAQLAEKLSDTQMLAGSEAYISALAAYRLFDAAAKAGVPGADAVYNMLKARFAAQGGSGAAPATTPPAPTT